MKLSALALLPLLAALPLDAQLAAPNAMGVTMGHVHLLVKDVEAERRFYIDMMGGTPIDGDKIAIVKFPGVYVLITQGEPTGLAAGSIADHFGFAVKDLATNMAKWEANHLIIDHAENPKAGYVHSPGGMRTEFFEDTSLNVPVIMNHIHFFMQPEVVPQMQAWYVKVFGGKAGQRACVSCVTHPRTIETVDLPGVNLSLAPFIRPTPNAAAPTKGRLLDHIGFEVKDLKAFIEKAQAQGIKFDEPYHVSASNSNRHVAFLTDPWGTRIELTEGLTP